MKISTKANEYKEKVFVINEVRVTDIVKSFVELTNKEALDGYRFCTARIEADTVVLNYFKQLENTIDEIEVED